LREEKTILGLQQDPQNASRVKKQRPRVDVGKTLKERLEFDLQEPKANEGPRIHI